MSGVLIIDGGAKWHGTGGTLTQSFVELATDVLNSLGHQVTVITVDRDFSVDEEVEKLVDADSIILQFPAWWMNPPWQVRKRGLDEYNAWKSANNGKGPWWNAQALHMRIYIPNALSKRMGLYSLRLQRNA